MLAPIFLLAAFSTFIPGVSSHDSKSPSWPNTTIWQHIQRVRIEYYEREDSMEPFLSRDGKWFFFNTQNIGDNTTLQYCKFNGPANVQWLGEIKGEANGPVPHLDAVPAMTNNNDFFWVSTRGWPSNPMNLEMGTFKDGVVPKATHVKGSFYQKVHHPTQNWIVMDQEINQDGSLLFYTNALFGSPPGPIPLFSNISFATKQPDGSWSEHPHAVTIMHSINNFVSSKHLRYGPSSLGTDALEFYFTCRVPNAPRVSELFVATRKHVDDPFGQPTQIIIPNPHYDDYLEPEASTISADGKLLMFSRMDCEGKAGCNYLHIYSMQRTKGPEPWVLGK
eukprot:TRINITY_DN102969_c0_g1_i1.p1 TRINITY_DN102969_c0_g1~~TRINITY_DN102969_c0_g1_i1.p1  ORF type:complete len:349 (+),score=18.77 TRINITY_DN102969_c0_g1_i1:45-1049(+)